MAEPTQQSKTLNQTLPEKHDPLKVFDSQDHFILVTYSVIIY
jgi:hypothetical protein